MATEGQTRVPLDVRESDDVSGATVVLDLDDKVFMKAVGGELQRLRKARTRLSRRLFVKILPWDIPVNTYACYEQGIRPCPLPRLVIICQVLGTTVGQVVENALTSLGLRIEVETTEACLSNIERALAELAAARQRLLALSHSPESASSDSPPQGVDLPPSGPPAAAGCA